MDTFEREASREGTGLATSTHKGYDYGGRKPAELVRMLEDRDRKIAILEKHIHEYEITLPNYPSCYPLIRLDIDNDVPARRRTYCRTVLVAWYFTILVLVFNMIAVFVAAQANNKPGSNVNNDKWEDGQWLSIAWLLGIPISFPLWFWTVYNSLVTGKQMRYNFSIVGIAVGICGCIFAIIGLAGFGVGGIFLLIKAKGDKQGQTAFLMVLACLVGWCIKTAFLVYALIRQVQYKRKDAKIAALSEQAAAILVKTAFANA